MNIHGKEFEQIVLEYMANNLNHFEKASIKHDHYEGTDCYINDYPFDITLNPTKDHYIELGYLYKNRYQRTKTSTKVRVGLRTGNNHTQFLIPVIVLDFRENITLDTVYEILDDDLIPMIKNILLDMKFLRNPDYLYDDVSRYKILECERRFGYFCDLFNLIYTDSQGILHRFLPEEEVARLKQNAEKKQKESIANDMGLSNYKGEYIPYEEQDLYDQAYDNSYEDNLHNYGF